MLQPIELRELAEKTGAETAFTEAIPALAELGGVAALLRY